MVVNTSHVFLFRETLGKGTSPLLLAKKLQCKFLGALGMTGEKTSNNVDS